MLSRRELFAAASAAVVVRGRETLTYKQRVERALEGKDVDRSPFTYWHHFGDSNQPGEVHAKSTLDFHRKFHTDLVKVMGDYPYPKPAGQWFEARVEDNPFPQQIRALELVRDGLGGQAHFIDTLFNPYYFAEKLSSKEAVARLRAEQPQKLLDALEVIAKSEANHARRSIATGSSGIFLAIQNSIDPEYAKFSEPFDKIVLSAVSNAPLNVLHIHGDKIAMKYFHKGWPVAAINYSPQGTGLGIAALRRSFPGVIMSGIDFEHYKTLSAADLKKQHEDARRQAGRKFILAPGCSVPDDSSDEELLRLTNLLHA